MNSNVWAPKPGKLRLVARSIRGALALVLAGGPAFTQGRADGWRPQTVPLWGASYSPDIGLLLGAGILHRPGERMAQAVEMHAEVLSADGFKAANTQRRPAWLIA